MPCSYPCLYNDQRSRGLAQGSTCKRSGHILVCTQYRQRQNILIGVTTATIGKPRLPRKRVVMYWLYTNVCKYYVFLQVKNLVDKLN